MIGTSFRPLADDSSLHWIDAATPRDCYGLLRVANDDTNTASQTFLSALRPRLTSVDRAVDFMMTHYEDLLRRLAD